ncbi:MULTISPECIES: hypothetical protein [unclassified Bradyrhizobium]
MSFDIGAHNRTHGMSKTPTYKTWLKMRERCCNPKAVQYKWYGAKGITVCDRWLNSFENFLADMGERPVGKTLDREDRSKGYEPGNCCWATHQEQTFNQAKTIVVVIDGEEMSLTEGARRRGVSMNRVHRRMTEMGLTFDEACQAGDRRFKSSGRAA